MKKLSWLKSRNEFKRIAKQMGLNNEQTDRLKDSMAKGDDAVMQTIKEIQNEQKAVLRAKGIDYSNTTPAIGKEIQWSDVLSMVFRVVDFDRNGTTVDIDKGGSSVVAKSPTEPYGYLLVEAPTLNQPVTLPIIHRDDFWLAASVFDKPRLYNLIKSGDAELLVTYAPKREQNGYLVGIEHALHYVFVPDGTLENYYSDTPEGNRRMSQPETELLFGRFIYSGAISVFMNTAPRI